MLARVCLRYTQRRFFIIAFSAQLTTLRMPLALIIYTKTVTKSILYHIKLFGYTIWIYYVSSVNIIDERSCLICDCNSVDVLMSMVFQQTSSPTSSYQVPTCFFFFLLSEHDFDLR